MQTLDDIIAKMQKAWRAQRRGTEEYYDMLCVQADFVNTIETVILADVPKRERLERLLRECRRVWQDDDTTMALRKLYHRQVDIDRALDARRTSGPDFQHWPRTPREALKLVAKPRQPSNRPVETKADLRARIEDLEVYHRLVPELEAKLEEAQRQGAPALATDAADLQWFYKELANAMQYEPGQEGSEPRCVYDSIIMRLGALEETDNPFRGEAATRELELARRAEAAEHLAAQLAETLDESQTERAILEAELTKVRAIASDLAKTLPDDYLRLRSELDTARTTIAELEARPAQQPLDTYTTQLQQQVIELRCRLKQYESPAEPEPAATPEPRAHPRPRGRRPANIVES